MFTSSRSIGGRDTSVCDSSGGGVGGEVFRCVRIFPLSFRLLVFYVVFFSSDVGFNFVGLLVVDFLRLRGIRRMMTSGGKPQENRGREDQEKGKI